MATITVWVCEACGAESKTDNLECFPYNPKARNEGDMDYYNVCPTCYRKVCDSVEHILNLSQDGCSSDEQG